ALDPLPGCRWRRPVDRHTIPFRDRQERAGDETCRHQAGSREDLAAASCFTHRDRDGARNGGGRALRIRRASRGATALCPQHSGDLAQSPDGLESAGGESARGSCPTGQAARKGARKLSAAAGVEPIPQWGEQTKGESRRMISGSIEIKCLTDPRDFLALESEWHRVAERCSSVSIFQTHEWQRTWWKHYGSGSLHILVAYAGSRAVAVLPLYKSAQRLPLVRSLQVLRQIGVGGDTSPDYLGQIAMDEYAREAADAFIRHLLEHRTDWDVLELTDLPDSSALREVLLAMQAPGGCIPMPEEP